MRRQRRGQQLFDPALAERLPLAVRKGLRSRSRGHLCQSLEDGLAEMLYLILIHEHEQLEQRVVVLYAAQIALHFLIVYVEQTDEANRCPFSLNWTD